MTSPPVARHEHGGRRGDDRAAGPPLLFAIPDLGPLSNSGSGNLTHYALRVGFMARGGAIFQIQCGAIFSDFHQ